MCVWQVTTTRYYRSSPGLLSLDLRSFPWMIYNNFNCVLGRRVGLLPSRAFLLESSKVMENWPFIWQFSIVSRKILICQFSWSCYYNNVHIIILPDDFSGPAESNVFPLGSFVPIWAGVNQQGHQPLLLLLEECIASTTLEIYPDTLTYPLITNKGCVHLWFN